MSEKKRSKGTKQTGRKRSRSTDKKRSHTGQKKKKRESRSSAQ